MGRVPEEHMLALSAQSRACTLAGIPRLGFPCSQRKITDANRRELL
jgi:hypothetical protein